MRSDRLLKKLDFKWVGPYQIKEVHGPLTYELELPHTMKIHPVFHISLLTPFIDNTIAGRKQTEPSPVIIEDEPEWEVEEILDLCYRRNRLEYLVKWIGYGPGDNTWEPADNVTNSPDLLQRFHNQYPQATSSTHCPPSRPTRCQWS